MLCSGAKSISSLSDFSKKGTITDADLYFGPLEGTPSLFHKKRLQFHNVPISEFQKQLQTNLTCIFLVYQSEFKAEKYRIILPETRRTERYQPN